MAERDEVTVGERQVYLKAIARKARKLAELCERPDLDRIEGVQDFLIAQYLHGVILSGIALSRPKVRAAFIGWVHDQVREYFGICTLCGKPKDEANAVACPDCILSLEAIDFEIGLTPEDLKADVARDLKDIAANPDPRD